MPRSLLRIRAKNYRCLDDVDVELGALSVLVGPNGSGKSTLLDVIQFLGDAVREDLGPAVARRGGFELLRFRGQQRPVPIVIGVEAAVTKFASETAGDEYTLTFRELPMAGRLKKRVVRREESFRFKRTRGKGRRLTVKGSKFTVHDDGLRARSRPLLQEQSLALSTLPRLRAEEGGEQINDIATLFASFRVFDVDTKGARLPSSVNEDAIPRLASDASNLSAFLHYLASEEDAFGDLLDDARAMIPGFKDIHFRHVGGAQEAVVVEIEEHWLAGRTPLAAASFGTIRALAILALLYDPDPPMLTCVEEIDHGFHPYLFDRLVELMRRASEKTQLLIATHSPALVNRLRAEEIIVCERNPETGGVRIPAVTREEIEAMMKEAGDDIGLGELWFSGSLGGVP